MTRESWKTRPSGPGDVPPNMAKAIQAYRWRSNMSQEDLASNMSALGFAWTRATVAKIETGMRRIDVPELLGVAATVGVPVVDLIAPVFSGEDYAEAGTPFDALRALVTGDGRSDESEDWPAADALYAAWGGN